MVGSPPSKNEIASVRRELAAAPVEVTLENERGSHLIDPSLDAPLHRSNVHIQEGLARHPGREPLILPDDLNPKLCGKEGDELLHLFRHRGFLPLQGVGDSDDDFLHFELLGEAPDLSYRLRSIGDDGHSTRNDVQGIADGDPDTLSSVVDAEYPGSHPPPRRQLLEGRTAASP